MSRSADTLGSAASILATLDWLDPTILATWVWLKLWARRRSFSSQAFAENR
jgi:hypothetical protein